MTRTKKYVIQEYPITTRREHLDKYKIFVEKAYGSGTMGETIPSPILASPMEICTETFIQIGSFSTKKEAQNALSYLKTKLFRLLVGIKKTTQDAPNRVYTCVPLQDFTQERNDEKLYKKYGLSEEEIAFIEKMVAPMD